MSSSFDLELMSLSLNFALKSLSEIESMITQSEEQQGEHENQAQDDEQ